MKKLFLTILSAACGLCPVFAQEQKAGELGEVVIKAEEKESPSISKPALGLNVDVYETVRDSLKPKELLLLADSPAALSFNKSSPTVLRNRRVIEPWRTALAEDIDLNFQPLQKLSQVLGRSVTHKETKNFRWSLNIADEEGKVFHRFSGDDHPPKELRWNGVAQDGALMKAGQAYSAVYQFTDALGVNHTAMDRPIKFAGVVHRESAGITAGLDSGILFGPAKDARQIVKPQGDYLMRSAVDWIKRRHFGAALHVRVYAKDASLAEEQAQLIRAYLAQELMVSPQAIAWEGFAAAHSKQRVDLFVLSR
ncbi:MAG: hypothetical protein HYT79_03910 [Elusimicrobia bacterium]|nr:hypothetical protein [Elusimicrobiota bacterium]